MTATKRVSNNQDIFARDAAHAEALAMMGQRMLGCLADHIDFDAKRNSNNWCCHRDCGNQLGTLHFHYAPAHMPGALELIYFPRLYAPAANLVPYSL